MIMIYISIWQVMISNCIMFRSVTLDLSFNSLFLYFFNLFKVFFFFFSFFLFFCFCFCFLVIFPGLSVFYFSFFRSCIFLSRSAWVCFLIHVFNLSIISCFSFFCLFVCLIFFCLIFFNFLLYILFSYFSYSCNPNTQF